MDCSSIMGKDGVGQLRDLGYRFCNAMRDEDYDSLLEIKEAYFSLWNWLSGSCLSKENILQLLTIQCSLLQTCIVLFAKQAVASDLQIVITMFHSMIEKLCIVFFNSSKSFTDSVDLLDCLKPVIISLQSYHVCGIYSLFLRMLILTSILESLLNSSFNPNLILMRAASILQPEENNRGQSNMCIMLDVKEFFDGHNSLERYYFRAWENFESGKYTEALDCVNQIKMTPTAGVQFLLVKLFQANCHLYLDNVNLAVVNCYDCLHSDNMMIVVLALFNCCYMFRKLNFFDELELRQLLIRCFNFLPFTNLIVSFDNKISLLSSIHLNYYDVTLYAGVRALELNRPDLTVSLLSEVLKKQDTTQQNKSIGNLLSIQAGLLCEDYEHCWTRLSEMICCFRAHTKNATTQTLINIFQLCFLGCTTALYINKVHLAENLGCQCFNIGNNLKSVDCSENFEPWVCHVQGLCLTLLSVINVGKNKMKRAKRMINSAASLSLSQSSLMVGSMIAAKEGQLQDAANYWHKGKSFLQEKGMSVPWPSNTFLDKLLMK